MAVHGPSINVDPDAIHDNVADEIGVIAEKLTPIAADEIIIEDSADSNNKKKIQVGNLPPTTSNDSDALHDNIAGEIDAVAEKVAPIAADILVIEDSADSNNKKKVQAGNLPVPSHTHTESEISDLDHIDADAIHDNVAGEIDSVSLKAAPVPGDQLLIEDSADVNNKKKVTVGSLPFTATGHTHSESDITDLDHTDTNALHDNVAGEITGIPNKAAPVTADNIVLEDSADSNNKKSATIGTLPFSPTGHTHTESEISDLDHTDADAIHDNVSGEINAVSEKATPIGADLILIEDSADSNSKKRIQISNLPGGGGGDADAIHDNVAGEITAIASKGTPVNADTIVIEDSAAADAKKSVTIGNLPFAAPSHTHTESEISDLDHTDADALHDNVAGEISLITNKTTPIGADLLVIEDSAATNAKKNVLIGSLPFTAPGHTHTESDITDLVHPFMEGWVKGLDMTFASVSTVSIEAGKCRDSADGFNIINTATRTADITTSGLNGLDTGTEAVSTWYALFIIDDSTGSNTEGALLSLSSTAPTLPGGYDVFKRVGWVRNNASGDFIKFIQTRTNDFRKVFYDEEITNLTVLSLGSATIYTGVSLAAFVPPTSLEPILALVIAPDDRGDFLEIRPTGSTMDNTTYKFNGIDDKNNSGYGIQETICSNLQNIEYRVTQASDDASIGVVGYYDQL